MSPQPSVVVPGIGVSPGRAVGPAAFLPEPVAEPPSGRRLPPGTDSAAQFEALGGLFAERVRDIEDVRDRLVAELTGRPAPGLPERGRSSLREQERQQRLVVAYLNERGLAG